MSRSAHPSPGIESLVKRKLLGGWRDFLNAVIDDHADSPALIYRGQARDWPLLSTLDRYELNYPTKRIRFRPLGIDQQAGHPPVPRKQHFAAFKHAARGRVSDAMLRERTEAEWWSLARHHGLATPILDWTLYPFMALFFAFEDETVTLKDQAGESQVIKPRSRFVYAAAHLGAGLRTPESRARWPKVFVPGVASSPRIVSQGAVCMMMPEPDYQEGKYRHHDFESIIRECYSIGSPPAANNVLGPILEVFEIRCDSESRKDCLSFLDKAGINRMALFPDLDGSAAYINSLWGLNFDTVLGILPRPQ